MMSCFCFTGCSKLPAPIFCASQETKPGKKLLEIDLWWDNSLGHREQNDRWNILILVERSWVEENLPAGLGPGTGSRHTAATF